MYTETAQIMDSLGFVVEGAGFVFLAMKKKKT